MSFFFITSVTAFSQETANSYTPETDSLVLKKIEQWQDLKFGLLMHWGAYSQWGIVESWSICSEDEDWCRRKNPDYEAYKKEYEALKNTFNPIRFDPAEMGRCRAGCRDEVCRLHHEASRRLLHVRYEDTDYKVTDQSVRSAAIRGPTLQRRFSTPSVQKGCGRAPTSQNPTGTANTTGGRTSPRPTGTSITASNATRSAGRSL